MLSFFTFIEKVFPTQIPPEVKSAGCFFTNDTLYLAGYQPNKKEPCVSGIGGHIENGESEFSAAIRELIEELFEIHPIPQALQKAIEEEAIPRKIVRNDSYTIFKFTFDDLECILKRMKEQGATSKLYDFFPTTIMDLILRRKIIQTAPLPEISHLVLLPFINQPLMISPFLLKDIQKI